MKRTSYSLSAIGICAIVVITVFFRSPSTPFPPWDRSSEYKYNIKEGGIYLQVVKHNEYVFVSQYGIWHSETPSLVKASKEHYEAFGIRDAKTEEEYERARLAYNEWEKTYNENEENQIDLTNPDRS